MTKWQAVVLGAALAALSGGATAGSYLRAMSWNTLHAGWSGQTDWSGYAAQAWDKFGNTSTSPNGLDVLFAQEVMYAESAASIASALTARSGVTWDYRVTAAIGRSSYKERYAVFFRPDRVQILSEYVWNDSGDHFEREPQIVKLRHVQTGADYTFINWHTVKAWSEPVALAPDSFVVLVGALEPGSLSSTHLRGFWVRPDQPYTDLPEGVLRSYDEP